MTYSELINNIKAEATNLVNVNSFYDEDVYDCWNRPGVKFSSVAVYLQSARREENTLAVTILMYYADRLTEGDGNRNFIWDDGIAVLQSILDKIEGDVFYETPVTYNPFEQQFADRLAGVYANVTLRIPYEWGRCGWADVLS